MTIKYAQIDVGHPHASKLAVYRRSEAYEVVGVAEPDERLRREAGRLEVSVDWGRSSFSASGHCEKEKGCTGNVRLAIPDQTAGLKFLDTNNGEP